MVCAEAFLQKQKSYHGGLTRRPSHELVETGWNFPTYQEPPSAGDTCRKPTCTGSTRRSPNIMLVDVGRRRLASTTLSFRRERALTQTTAGTTSLQIQDGRRMRGGTSRQCQEPSLTYRARQRSNMKCHGNAVKATNHRLYCLNYALPQGMF